MQPSSLQLFPALALVLTTLPILVSCAFNWDDYPSCARPILQANAPSSCDYGSVGDETILTNNCLCPNLGYFTDIAQDIFANCGCVDLKQSGQVANINCAKYGDIPAALGVDDFISVGDGGEQTCGVKNDTSEASGSGGWDAGSIAGVVVAVIFGTIAAVLAFLQLLVTIGAITNPNVAPWPYIRDFFKCLWCC